MKQNRKTVGDLKPGDFIYEMSQNGIYTSITVRKIDLISLKKIEAGSSTLQLDDWQQDKTCWKLTDKYNIFFTNEIDALKEQRIRRLAALDKAFKDQGDFLIRIKSLTDDIRDSDEKINKCNQQFEQSC